MNDQRLETLLTSSDPIPGAGLGTRIFINRLRIEARAKPGLLADKVAELRAHIARNPDVASELA